MLLEKLYRTNFLKVFLLLPNLCAIRSGSVLDYSFMSWADFAVRIQIQSFLLAFLYNYKALVGEPHSSLCSLLYGHIRNQLYLYCTAHSVPWGYPAAGSERYSGSISMRLILHLTVRPFLTFRLDRCSIYLVWRRRFLLEENLGRLPHLPYLFKSQFNFGSKNFLRSPFIVLVPQTSLSVSMESAISVVTILH